MTLNDEVKAQVVKQVEVWLSKGHLVNELFMLLLAKSPHMQAVRVVDLLWKYEELMAEERKTRDNVAVLNKEYLVQTSNQVVETIQDYLYPLRQLVRLEGYRRDWGDADRLLEGKMEGKGLERTGEGKEGDEESL